ncbi:MAG: aminotransferase class V-fold PLP-dependent enzyme [Candidatus Aminicenantes bacterium]|nr:aminotransferase class V-fold PLP-dependent enzyme [Candidatus Aminicenantes bacterium]
MPHLEWKKGICGICPAGCWVEAGFKNGKLKDIRADKDHRLGMLCRRGEHASEIVYSPHRLQSPLRRTGPKGTYQFESITWDQAYEDIVKNLNQIKQESGPEAAAIYTGRGAFELSLNDMYKPKEAAVSSASNILFPFGSPNTMGVGALCYVSFAMIAPHLTLGRMLINMFTDIENAELLLVWGANPATDSPPLDMYRLEAAAQRGAEVINIDPRHTETAERIKARWIPVRPGTDGALALSMIQVLIQEELYDEEFTQNWCHGFEELQSYVQHFTPEKAEPITGVPSQSIIEIAQKIAAAKGACPVMYTGLEYSNSGIQAIRAVHTLFAIAGQLDVPGGIGLAMQDSHFPINRSCNQENPAVHKAVARDLFPIYTHYRGESHASGLVPSVLHSEPYKIRSLIIHGGSILTSWPQTPIWRQTLSQLDFLVTIDRQLTADSAYADIVLPATTMFEINSYMVYGPIFRLREQIVEPLGEARNDYLIMAELADRLGYGHLYPQTEEQLLEFALKDSGYTLEEIKKAGGWVKIQSPVMEYKKWEKGSLRQDKEPGFETPTQKFEIKSSILEDYGYEPLPKYTEVKEGPLSSPELAQKYPLVFNSGARPQTDFRSQHHGIKGLLRDNPEPTVEINPKDARKRNIETGDLVKVKTPRGEVPFRARVTSQIIQGSIECNMGGGTPVGPKAWQDWNVNELTDLSNYDEISGFPVYKALLCEVEKTAPGTEKSKKSAASRTQMSESSSPVLAPSPKQIQRNIYLDNNATTQMDDAVRKEMMPYLEEKQGNPSSIHESGDTAQKAVEKARRQVARLIHTKSRRIIFTGGGSESNNLAIKGIAFALKNKGNHIITSQIEHPANLKACDFLERSGYRVTYLRVDPYGTVSPEKLEKAITEQTILISIMMANNEVGTLLPIKQLCRLSHQRGIVFHTDAVQAVGKINVNVEDLDADLLSLSGHKFHGPKGVGALYVKKGIRLEPLIHGGKQERGMRAGTHNVPAIVGLGKAAEIAFQKLPESDQVRKLRDQLERGIKNIFPEAELSGHLENRLPNTLNLILPGIRGESLVIALDQKGIALSSGSACKSGSPEPTHVLLAMGKSEQEAHCAVRFSLSRMTRKKDIEETISVFQEVIQEMESTIRFLPCK